MQLTTTFSQPANEQIKTRAILAGFAFLIAIFLSFVPVLGEVLDAGLTAAIVAGISITANAACGSAGTFIGLSLMHGYVHPFLNTGKDSDEITGQQSNS